MISFHSLSFRRYIYLEVDLPPGICQKGGRSVVFSLFPLVQEKKNWFSGEYWLHTANLHFQR